MYEYEAGSLEAPDGLLGIFLVKGRDGLCLKVKLTPYRMVGRGFMWLDADGRKEGFWDMVEKRSYGSSTDFELNCIMRPGGPTDRQSWGKAGEAESLHVPHQDGDSLASLPDKARHGPLRFLKRAPPPARVRGAGAGQGIVSPPVIFLSLPRTHVRVQICEQLRLQLSITSICF